MKKKVLIFGATGNIGVYLTDYLLKNLNENEYEIIAIGKRKTDFFDRYGVNYISIDICDKSSFAKLPKKNIFAAIHLANILPARMMSDNPYEYFNINVLGSINILEYLREIRADRIVFTQSYADVAGHWTDEQILYPNLSRKLKYNGDHALYAISKCTVEDIIEYYHETYQLKNFVLRLPNIYMYAPAEYYYVDGKKQIISYRYIIKRAMAGESIELWGNPERVRDMVYIKDFCQLVYRTLLSNLMTGHYNVGTGVGTSMQEQIEGVLLIKNQILYIVQKRRMQWNI